MACVKCGYEDEKNEVKRHGEELCTVCATFAPSDEEKFKLYIDEKIDWQKIDTFREHGEYRGAKQKKGMKLKAEEGKVMTRAPLGYNVESGGLVTNEKSLIVNSIFKEFLDNDDSLNEISKKYGLSVNGLKKVLKNRTYLGEIKFDREFHKGDHKPIISPEIFYAVQRKLHQKLKPRMGLTANKHVLKGEKEPLKIEENDKSESSGELYNSAFNE